MFLSELLTLEQRRLKQILGRAGDLVRISGSFTYCEEPLAGGAFREGPRMMELRPSPVISELRGSGGRAIIIIERTVSQIMLESLGASLIFML